MGYGGVSSSIDDTGGIRVYPCAKDRMYVYSAPEKMVCLMMFGCNGWNFRWLGERLAGC